MGDSMQQGKQWVNTLDVPQELWFDAARKAMGEWTRCPLGVVIRCSKGSDG